MKSSTGRCAIAQVKCPRSWPWNDLQAHLLRRCSQLLCCQSSLLPWSPGKLGDSLLSWAPLGAFQGCRLLLLLNPCKTFRICVISPSSGTPGSSSLPSPAAALICPQIPVCACSGPAGHTCTSVTPVPWPELSQESCFCKTCICSTQIPFLSFLV